MKLGIALIVIFGADALLNIGFLLAGYAIGFAGGIRLCFIDLVLILYGVKRVINARRRTTQ